MFIEIKPELPITIFQQIMDGIRYAILIGHLQQDDKLPSWRDLAVELRINPNTVAKAYQELERAGVLYVKRGEGTFVSPWPKSERDKERIKILRNSLSQGIIIGFKLQFQSPEIRSLFKEVMDKNADQWETEHDR